MLLIDRFLLLFSGTP